MEIRICNDCIAINAPRPLRKRDGCRLGSVTQKSRLDVGNASRRARRTGCPPGSTRASRPFLPNRSDHNGALPQVFQPQQHGQHAFELAVEMDLVAAKPLQLVRVESLTECLFADQGPVRQFLLAVLEPRKDFVL